MTAVRSIPGFMIAAAILLVSMVPGAIALFGMNHGFIVYYTLFQGGLYATFAWLLLRDHRALSAPESQRYFIYLLGFAILMRALLLFAPPHSTDIYRYVWDGRVQAAGINPYLYVPADPALERRRDHDIYLNINRKEYAPTIYPPAAQIIYFAVSRLSETVTMTKAAMLAFEALGVWALVKLLQARERPILLASIYLLHPMAVWEVAGSGHIDIVAVALSLLALLAAEKGKGFASGAALAAGVLTKYFPAALIPAVYRRWDWRMPAAFTITVLALYLPYLSVGKKVFGFLGGYAGEEVGEGAGFYIATLLSELGFGSASLPVFLAFAAAALFALSWRIGFRAEPGKPDLHGAFTIAVAFTVLFSPHYAWYFLWLIPFLCFFPRPSVFWLTLSATILYRAGWPVGFAGQSILYVPFTVLFVVENCRFVHKEAPDGRAVA